MMSRRAVAAAPLGGPATRSRTATLILTLRFAGPLASRRTVTRIASSMAAMAVVIVATMAAAPAFAQASAVKEAERLAAEAIATADARPDAALAAARRALALTAEFQPTSFVRAGRRGEVVEDEYTAARTGYRRHRAPVYEAMGVALAAQGRHLAAARYLRRAMVLDPDDGRAGRLAESLLALGRSRDALAVLHARGKASGGFGPSLLPVLERAVDAEGRASAQVEIDLARLSAVPGIVVRDGPIPLPTGARLSTGAPLRLESAPTVFYLAGRSCATCSADLEAIKRAVPQGTRVALVPVNPDEDRALRQVVDLYRLRWPMVLGAGIASALGGEEDHVVVVGRGGWIAVTLAAPFEPALAEVVRILSRSDVAEALPRPAWSRRPVDRTAPAPPAGLLPEGFAMGDDGPPPPEFERALAAYRGRRFAEALRQFEAVAAAEDGWLLPPEARLNRAIVLAALGRREEARRIVLRIGDARLEDAADQALDRIFN
jgi:tetratricopeptide (TPR) repeat protein